MPSVSWLQTGDGALHTDTQFSEPVIAFGSPSSEELNELLNDTSTRHAAKPANPLPQENNAPNNAALAGVGSGGGGNASSTPFAPGGGNSVGGGGGGGGGANWNLLLNNSVNLASNAAPTMPAMTSIATASTAPATLAAATSPSPVVGAASSVSVSPAMIGRNTGSSSPTSPGVKLLSADSSGSQDFNTPGTSEWTAPPGVTSVSIQEWGAGGGGGGGGGGATGGYTGGSGSGGGYCGGGGGGAGAYVNVGAISVVPGNKYTVVVGAGGTGGTGGSHMVAAGEGDNGGNSSFSGTDIGTYLAAGGTGGEGGPASFGGPGGVPGDGDGGSGSIPDDSGIGSNVGGGGGGGGSGGPCGAGNSGASADPNSSVGGLGGSGDMGSGDGGNGGNAGSSGSDGQSPGGGGGGGGANNSGVGGNGGNGGNGEVFIAWIAPNNNDTLWWNPCKGSTDASDAENWYDQKEGRNGFVAPGPDNPVIFDGSPGSTISQNAPCTWTNFVTVASITIQNGYDETQTINPNLKVEDIGSLTEDNSPSSTLYVEFGTNAVLQIDDGGNITNLTLLALAGSSNGQFILNGGTTTMAQAPGFTETEKLGVNFLINPGAIVNYQSNNSLQLRANNLAITVKGELDFYYGTLATNGITLIDGGVANALDYIDVNGGKLAYYGRQNITDTITVPIKVENGGTFLMSVSSNSGKPLQGTLKTSDKTLFGMGFAPW